jgi:hypothetical protein
MKTSAVVFAAVVVVVAVVLVLAMSGGGRSHGRRTEIINNWWPTRFIRQDTPWLGPGGTQRLLGGPGVPTNMPVRLAHMGIGPTPGYHMPGIPTHLY